MADSIMNFRVDQDLKNAFDKAAKDMDLTSSQLLRHYMRQIVDEYMTSNAQGSLLEAKKTPKATPAPKKAKNKPKSVIPQLWRKE